MRLKLISCDIFAAEVQATVRRSRNEIHVDFLTPAPHMQSADDAVRTVQSLIDGVDRARFHAALLLAGSCKQSFAGLRAGNIPLVVPRARDCISLFLEQVHAPVENVQGFGLCSCQGSSARRLLPRPQKRATGTYWMAPVFGENARQDAPPRRSQGWAHRRLDHNPAVAPIGRRNESRRLSLIEMLIDGYWNHKDFLVIPAGWRAVMDPDGTMRGEELSS